MFLAFSMLSHWQRKTFVGSKWRCGHGERTSCSQRCCCKFHTVKNNIFSHYNGHNLNRNCEVTPVGPPWQRGCRGPQRTRLKIHCKNTLILNIMRETVHFLPIWSRSENCAWAVSVRRRAAQATIKTRSRLEFILILTMLWCKLV